MLALCGFMKPLNLLMYIDRGLAVCEKGLLCLSLTLMLGIASAQVILRNAFGSGLEWGDVAVRHLVLYVLFFGASLATRDKRHIQMDLSAKMIPTKVKPYIDLVVNGFCVAVTVLLCRSSYAFWLSEKQVGDMLVAPVPTWTVITVIPIGFALIALRFGLTLSENIGAICGSSWCFREKPEGILP